MALLGIDYGLKHCGLAFSSGQLAEPLGTVSTEKIVSVLPRIISKQQINTIVIGVPSGPVKKKVMELSDEIRPLFAGKIYFEDETLSSHLAVKSLLHTTASRRRKLEHAVAAAIILQSWLDSNATSV